jgi:hypothetical protein
MIERSLEVNALIPFILFFYLFITPLLFEASGGRALRLRLLNKKTAFAWHWVVWICSLDWAGCILARSKSDKPFYCSRERRCMISMRKRLIAGVGGLGRFWFGWGLVDQIWRAGGLDAMSFCL